VNCRSALVVLAVIALGTALCAGCGLLSLGEPPVPDSSPTPDAGSTPTPGSTSTPEAGSTPTPESTPKPSPEKTEVPPPADFEVLRELPRQVRRGETFTVTVVFVAPEDHFNAVGLTDLAPEGWVATADVGSSTPEASLVNARGDRAEILWNGPFTQGTTIRAGYEVTVPGNAGVGTYRFGDGFLEYYVGGDGSFRQPVEGSFDVTVA